MTSSPNCSRAKADLGLLGYYAWGKANSDSDRSGSFPWFAHGCAGYGKHFPPAPSSLEISSRNCRVAALQKRWDHLRAGLDPAPGPAGCGHGRFAGRRQRDAGARLQGKRKPISLETRIDLGVVSLVAELRGHERQAAEELGQWKTRVEERKVIDASPAAIKPAARHGEPAHVFPAISAPADGRPRLDGGIGWSGICAVASGAADGRPSLSKFPPLEPGSGPR
jgi:hypothetical protein